jgi:hypothetical protein
VKVVIVRIATNSPIFKKTGISKGISEKSGQWKGPVPKIARRFGFEQQLELPIPWSAPEIKRPPTGAAYASFPISVWM